MKKIFLCSLLLLGGCSLGSSGPEIEKIPSQQVLLESLDGVPTTFHLDREASREAWTRALYFMNHYTVGVPEEKTNALVSSSGDENRFRYVINKMNKKDGVTFQVLCTVKENEPLTQGAADQNARNVARFLREGTLEVNLLTQ